MFKRIKGNAKGCLIYEPMWVIPFNMFTTYASVYMLELGVSETQIGLITSIGLTMQMFTSFISGYLTDRMGRRRALLIFDLISWSVATFIWAISKNIWYFVIAAIVNGFQKVPNTAWYCLLVEDTDPKDRSLVFTVLQIVGVIAGLFAPLGGLLVHRYTLVPAMRIMYAMACISMTIMFLGRNHATHETEIGIRKRQESLSASFIDSLKEYAYVLKHIFLNKPLMVIFGVYILNNFQVTMRTTYLSVYLINVLKLNDAFIAVFPAVSSTAMLLLLLLAVPRFKEEWASRYMIYGFMISAVANLMLILIPTNNTVWVIISTILVAAGTVISNPYLETAVANAIDDENRAKIFSILTVLILAFVSPSGVIGGWTYSINPRIPFILIALALASNAMLVMAFFRIRVGSVSVQETA